jgi:hypothetical protein
MNRGQFSVLIFNLHEEMAGLQVGFLDEEITEREKWF